MLLSVVWEFGRLKDNSSTRGWPKTDCGMDYHVFNMQPVHFCLIYCKKNERSSGKQEREHRGGEGGTGRETDRDREGEREGERV